MFMMIMMPLKAVKLELNKTNNKQKMLKFTVENVKMATIANSPSTRPYFRLLLSYLNLNISRTKNGRKKCEILAFKSLLQEIQLKKPN